jgi:hypothetical protein
MVNNNSFKYNFNSLKSNDKKEKFSQYSSANSLVKNDTSKQIGKTSSVRAPKNKSKSKSKSKSKKNNNKKTKNSSNYNTDKKDKNKNKKQYVNHYRVYSRNQKVIIIQAHYRGHSLRNKLTDLFNLYKKYKKLVNAINNLKFYKKTFWNNLCKINPSNKNNKNNINKDNNKPKSKSKNKSKNIKYIICKIDNINYFGNSNNSNKTKKKDKDNNNHN